MGRHLKYFIILVVFVNYILRTGWIMKRFRSLMIFFLTKHYSGDQIKKNDMGEAHSMHGEEMRVTYKVLVGET